MTLPTTRELRALRDRDVAVAYADAAGAIHHLAGQLLSVGTTLWLIVAGEDRFVPRARLVSIAAAGELAA